MPDAWAQDIGNPSRLTSNGNRWVKFPTSRSRIDPEDPDGPLLPRARRRSCTSRTSSACSCPSSSTSTSDQGYCWVVVGSTQRGRAEAEPERSRRRSPTTASSSSASRLAYEASPYARGRGPGRVQLRLDVRLLPAGLPPARAGDVGLPAHRRPLRCGDAGVTVVDCRRACMALRTDTDREHLARAIELAQRGLGHGRRPTRSSAPSSCATATVLGEGWHEEYGGPHAEVNAIARRRRATLRGATLYVSLEPCCHHGKTPPCTDAIVAAGIAPRRRRLRRPDREGLRPRPRDPARRGHRGRRRRRRARRAARGCSTRPSASTRAPAARGCSSSRR